jgi:hypothetical protein
LDEIGAPINDEADEIEEEREDRDEVSEIIDSGEDIEIELIELANEDRRLEMYDTGEEVCHLSVT